MTQLGYIEHFQSNFWLLTHIVKSYQFASKMIIGIHRPFSEV